MYLLLNSQSLPTIAIDGVPRKEIFVLVRTFHKVNSTRWSWIDHLFHDLIERN